MIRLGGPDIGDREVRAAEAVLRSGWLIQGEQVKKFEEGLHAWSGASNVVAVSSGTAALHLALLALDIQEGDVVFVPTYSWPATANVVEVCGARPIFVDIDPSTFSMNPGKLEEAILQTKQRPELGRPAAIVVVHPFGVIHQIASIAQIARRLGLPLIEDAACAVGTTYDGQFCGTWGLMSCLSFHPRKVLTTGEGGAVLTSDTNLADRLRLLRAHGLRHGANGASFVTAGLNYRLTEFQAAIGLEQLSRLPEMLSKRKEIAAHYSRLFEGTPVAPQGYESACRPNFQSYVIRVPTGTRAMVVVEHLKIAGIEATIGTWHIPLTEYYRTRYHYRAGCFPATDEVFEHAVTIPLHAGLTSGEREHVVERVLEITRRESGGAGAPFVSLAAH